MGSYLGGGYSVGPSRGGYQGFGPGFGGYNSAGRSSSSYNMFGGPYSVNNSRSFQAPRGYNYAFVPTSDKGGAPVRMLVRNPPRPAPRKPAPPRFQGPSWTTQMPAHPPAHIPAAVWNRAVAGLPPRLQPGPRGVIAVPPRMYMTPVMPPPWNIPGRWPPRTPQGVPPINQFPKQKPMDRVLPYDALHNYPGYRAPVRYNFTPAQRARLARSMGHR